MSDLPGVPTLTYVLQFHRAGRTVGDTSERGTGPEYEPVHEAPAFGSGLSVTTRIANGSVSTEEAPVPGDQAILDVTVTQASDTTFYESGTITFNGSSPPSTLSFSSIGTGTLLDPIRDSGLTHGVVNWKIDSGIGAFAGATGAISSNFLVDLASDELHDTHLALVWLP